MAYMCNTSNIKEMKHGRPQTVMFEGRDTKPNGIIVTLQDTMEGANGRDHDHVHKIEYPQQPGATVDTVVGKFIVVAPEIIEEEYRLIDGQISKFALKPSTTYSAYQLEKLDRIEYSDSYFTGDLSQMRVGDYVNINNQGQFVKNGAGTANNSAFRVVSKTPMFYPVILGKNAPIGGAGQPGNPATFLPTSGIKFKLEVVR